MDKDKVWIFLLVLSMVFMLVGSALSIIGGINENTAVKIACILCGGVLCVLSAFCSVMAIIVRDEK